MPVLHRAHTRSARHKGGPKKEIMEAIWVAAEMRAGAAIAHSVIALIMKEHAPSEIGCCHPFSGDSVAFVQSEEAASSELRRSAEKSLVTAGKNKCKDKQPAV